MALTRRGRRSPRCSPCPPCTTTSCASACALRVSIVLQTSEARDVSQIALLISYGASAVYPVLAFETITDLVRRDAVPNEADPAHAHAAYIKAVNKGLLKIMSKMGISTLQSYCGAQTFEAVGLSHDLVQRHFTGTSSRLGGVDLDVIADETLRRHTHAYGTPSSSRRLDVGGNYHYRIQGEAHLWNPRTISTLQHATRSARYDTFKEFSRVADAESRNGSTIRGLLDFVGRDPVRM